MSDLDFERRLEGLFAEAPAFPDADLFTLKVAQKLDQGWMTRRLLIGGFGAVGGAIGATQLAASGLMTRLGGIELPSFAEGADRITALMPPQLTATGVSAETLGMSVVLAVVALVLGLSRAIREI